MNRAPRPPKRSTTPTLSRRASEESIPATPTSPSAAKPLYLCSPFVEAALVKGNFKHIVMLPKYADVMEWVAVNSACRRYHPYIPRPSHRDAFVYSIRLLPEPQLLLRGACRMLYSAVVPFNGCWPQVCASPSSSLDH